MQREAYAALLAEFNAALDLPSDQALPICAELSKRMARLVRTWEDEMDARAMQQAAYQRRIGV